MNELQVVVNQTPGKIEWNFEELKTALVEQLKIYKTMVYTDDSIASAKADVAMLRKLRKSVDSRRKEIKEKCLEPFAVIDAQAKELMAVIDEPISYVDKCVKEYDEAQRKKKHDLVMQYFDTSLRMAQIPEDVHKAVIEARYDTRWENKTTTQTQWMGAITKITDDTKAELKIIGDMEEEFRDQCMSIYLKSLSLARAMEKQNELRQAKERILAAERKRQEEERARQEAARMKAEREAAIAAERERREAEERAERERMEALRAEREQAERERIAAAQAELEAEDDVTDLSDAGEEEKNQILRNAEELETADQPNRLTINSDANVVYEYTDNEPEEEKEESTPGRTFRFHGSDDLIKKMIGYAQYIGLGVTELTLEGEVIWN